VPKVILHNSARKQKEESPARFSETRKPKTKAGTKKEERGGKRPGKVKKQL